MKKTLFRIAFRNEGNNVNAYYANPNNMDDAIWVASIKAVCLDKTPGAFEDFQILMRKIFDQMIKDMGMENHGWETLRAPESERTGNA